jgi:hypothetical protein
LGKREKHQIKMLWGERTSNLEKYKWLKKAAAKHDALSVKSKAKETKWEDPKRYKSGPDRTLFSGLRNIC